MDPMICHSDLMNGFLVDRINTLREVATCLEHLLAVFMVIAMAEE